MAGRTWQTAFEWVAQKRHDSLGSKVNTPHDDPAPEGADHKQAQEFEGTRIWLRYIDAQDEISERYVRVLNFQQSQFVDYLNAYCELRGELRTFRVDRIIEVGDADGEIHDPTTFFSAFLPSRPDGRSSGPSRHSGFGRALRLVDSFGDIVRILTFVAEADGKFVPKEADTILRFIESEAATLGILLSKRDIADFRAWMKLLKPDASSLESATLRIAKAGRYSADDVLELADIVAEIDGKVPEAENKARYLIAAAIRACFT